jgi:hypothetical protein
MSRLVVFLATLALVLLAAWDTWEATGNLVGLPAFYRALGIADSIPWVLLIAGVVVPWLAVIGGLVWARGRGLPSRLLMYTIVAAASSAVALSLLAAEQAWRASVLLSSLD